MLSIIDSSECSNFEQDIGNSINPVCKFYCREVENHCFGFLFCPLNGHGVERAISVLT